MIAVSSVARRAIIIAALIPSVVGAQGTVLTLTTRVLQDTVPVADAMVRAGALRVRTDIAGVAALHLAPGTVTIVVTHLGFRPDTARLLLVSDTTIVFRLDARPTGIAPVLVMSTRAERRLEDEPLRVEVLGGEDVSEKAMMRPADSRTLLTEMSGVRVQAASPLGATNVRIQGLPGRYTAILSDGVPLFGGQASSFTLVEVVPLDLRQAEVIKGAASALYGPQALGGVVNLISRRPPDTSEALLSQSAPSSSDAMAFVSKTLSTSWGSTLLAGVHRQRRADADHDGWNELPGFHRVEIRPRLFFDDSAGHSLMATAGAFAENRFGGTSGVPAADPGPHTPFADSLVTRHGDLGLTGTWSPGGAWKYVGRFAGDVETRHHQFGGQLERDTRRMLFAEGSASRSSKRSSLVAGVALQRERYANTDVPRFDARYATEGLFVQETFSPVAWGSATFNGRCDTSDGFGTICSPRLSTLMRLAPWLTARASGGTGWYAPRPLTDETETFGLSRVNVPSPLAAERGRAASLDLTATRGALEIDGTLFTNRVSNPVGMQRVPGDTTGAISLINAAGPLYARGGELFAVYNQEPFIATAYYSATRTRGLSTENGLPREFPLTPRQTAGLDFAVEDDESGAYGAVEIFYVGRQSLEDNPYAKVSSPYTTVGLLLSYKSGRATVFANGENLTGVRLTDHHPLLRTRAGEGGRWTVDPWSPLEGRRVSGGVRWRW